jgi:hypothetical protein
MVDVYQMEPVKLQERQVFRHAESGELKIGIVLRYPVYSYGLMVRLTLVKNFNLDVYET